MRYLLHNLTLFSVGSERFETLPSFSSQSNAFYSSLSFHLRILRPRKESKRSWGFEKISKTLKVSTSFLSPINSCSRAMTNWFLFSGCRCFALRSLPWECCLQVLFLRQFRRIKPYASWNWFWQQIQRRPSTQISKTRF